MAQALRFTIEVLDRLRVRLKGINEATLPDLSRAMTASTLDAVSGRGSFRSVKSLRLARRASRAISALP